MRGSKAGSGMAGPPPPMFNGDAAQDSDQAAGRPLPAVPMFNGEVAQDSDRAAGRSPAPAVPMFNGNAAQDSDQAAGRSPAPAVPMFNEDPAPGVGTSRPSDAPKVPYDEPSWGGLSSVSYSMMIMKGGVVLDPNFSLAERSFYAFGRQPDCCDVVLDHPSCSRVHCVVQFRKDGASFVYDNKSTHGTFVNKNMLKPRSYCPLRVGDVLKFGQSSRLYVFQGPSELMPEEASPEPRRQPQAEARPSGLAKEGEGGEDEEIDGASLDWRLKHERGELTDNQSKIASGILRRERTVANLRSEVERIRAKADLSEGQNHQIARNEKKISQLEEEADRSEDQLEESLAESLLGKRRGRGRGAEARGGRRGDRGGADDDDDDDDDFFDRTAAAATKKRRKGGQREEARTVESLVAERQAMAAQREERVAKLKEMVRNYSASVEAEAARGAQGADEMDAYVSSMKRRAKEDQIRGKEAEIETLDREMAAVERLIRLADPAAEWDAKPALCPVHLPPPPTRVAQAPPSSSKPAVGARPAVVGGGDQMKAEAEKEVEAREEKTKEVREAEEAILSELGVLSRGHRARAIETLDDGEPQEAWVPPQGQTGDGNTGLNNRFGY